MGENDCPGRGFHVGGIPSASSWHSTTPKTVRFIGVPRIDGDQHQDMELSMGLPPNHPIRY